MCYLAWMEREYKALRRLSMRIIINNDINISPRNSQGEQPAGGVAGAVAEEQTARLRQRRFGVVIRPETLRNMDRFTRYYM